MTATRSRAIATAFAAAGLVALLAGCEQAGQATAAAPTTSSYPAPETLAPVVDGLAADTRWKLSATVTYPDGSSWLLEEFSHDTRIDVIEFSRRDGYLWTVYPEDHLLSRFAPPTRGRRRG